MPRPDLVLRPGRDGARLVPDVAYPRAFTLRVGRTDQSYVDLDDPRRLEFDYLEQIALVLDQLAPPGTPLRTVHVGGAAMSLARYVAATRPRSSQVVLEPDTELTAFVREHLPLPPRSGIRVRGVDGRSGLAALRDGYADVVIVDAFVGPRTPAELTSLEFWTDVHRVLGPSGTVLVNITDRGPLGYGRRVLAGLAACFARLVLMAEASTLKGRRFGNVVLVGSDAALPVDPIAAEAGRAAYPYRVVTGDRLTQLLGGVAPFTDAEGEESPAPPHGLMHFG
ncbi:MAG TPA: fused MFS/spermidine synthase [Propionibacteriaceae bacterium]|nr:fused MFS/spermidine synthase [Propionibacteriaceae bacterium]